MDIITKTGEIWSENAIGAVISLIKESDDSIEAERKLTHWLTEMNCQLIAMALARIDTELYQIYKVQGRRVARRGGPPAPFLCRGPRPHLGAHPAMVEQRWQQICAKGANRPLGTARTPARPWRFLGGRKLPLFRAVPGPQTDAFTAVGRAAFVHGVYALTADCDRMACKLQGPQIETVDGSDIVSDGIVAGSVQVSANGQPIVMLADHQTTGGYAKIATVISADLSAMAQLRPGEKLAFQYVTAAQAVAGARAQAAVLDKIRERMK